MECAKKEFIAKETQLQHSVVHNVYIYYYLFTFLKRARIHMRSRETAD